MARKRVRIDKLVEAWEPVLQRAFLESVRNMRDEVQIGRVAEALAAGDVERAIRAVGLDPVSFRPYDKSVTDMFEAGGRATAASFPSVVVADGLRMKFQFDVRNPAAERWLAERAVTKVVGIVEDQVIVVRDHMVAGLEKGTNPRSIALDIAGRIGPSGRREGGVLGLTSSQAEWVRNYSAELASDNPRAALSRALRDRRFDKAVLRAAEAGEPVPADLREKMVTAYENRAVRYRAEGIARTEAMASLHESQQQAIEQAVASGGVSADDVTFIWHATDDDRTRDSHAEMDGEEVKLGEKFVTGDGNYLEYPGDPDGPPSEIINCRCWREPSVDFLARAA